MTKELVIKAMKMAIKRERPKNELIFHSDRGSQYCSNDFRDLLETNKILQSMSRKGNCYDNACAENLFRCLKCECTNFYHFRNRDYFCLITGSPEGAGASCQEERGINAKLGASL